MQFPRAGHFPSCILAESCRCVERGYLWLMLSAIALWPIEFIGGIISGSQSLLGDSVHVLSDTGVYFVAWLGFFWARGRPDRRIFLTKTARIIRVILIGTALGIILYASYQLVYARETIVADYNPSEALFFGGAGMLVNLWMYCFLKGFTGLHLGEHRHPNEGAGIHFGALIHTLGDLLGSLAVVVCALGVLADVISPLWDRGAAVAIGILVILGVVRGLVHANHPKLQ